jgi:hypothetical protein
MFAEIIQETKNDSWMLRSLGFESICDPLLISFRFLFIAMRNQWSKDTTKQSLQPRGESIFWLDMLELRGLSMRTILRQSSEKPCNAELEGAIEIFELAELLYSNNSTRPHFIAKQLHNTNSVVSPSKVRGAVMKAYDSCKQRERRLRGTWSFEFEYLDTTLAVQVLQDGIRNGFLELLSLQWTPKLRRADILVEQGCEGEMGDELAVWSFHSSRSAAAVETKHPTRRLLLYGIDA